MRVANTSNCSHHSGMPNAPSKPHTGVSPAVPQPSASAAHCRQPPGLFGPVIDRNRCEGKGPCVDACPHGVLSLGVLDAAGHRSLSLKGRLKAWAHGGKQAFITAPDACAACGDCVRVCPEQAITLARRAPAVTPTETGAPT